MIINLEILTYEYDIDLKELVIKRFMSEHSESIEVIGIPESSDIKIAIHIKLLPLICSFLSELIMKILCPMEIARYIDLYAVDQNRKKSLMNQTLRKIEHNTFSSNLADRLENYFRTNKKLILEGYVHFLMSDELAFWKECVEQTIDDVLLHSEYMELIRLVGLFIGTPYSETNSLELKFNSDGSCILSDKQNLKIESPPGYDDDMLDLLINMSPNQLTVIDNSSSTHNNFLAKLSSKLNKKINIVYRPNDLT